jgi:hypothetical protein
MKTTNIVKSIVAIAAVAAVALSVNAANKGPAPVTGSVGAKYANQNYYRGGDLGDETLSLSVGLDGTLGGVGVFGDVLSAQSIGTDFGDQYYISAGVASTLFENVDVTGGYLHTENVPGDATGELFGTASLGVVLNPTVGINYNPDDELLSYIVGVSHSVEVAELDVTGHACYGDTELTSTTDRAYYLLGVSAGYGLTDTTDLTVAVDYVDPDDADDETIFSVGINVRF